jgi:hypothetical protein
MSRACAICHGAPVTHASEVWGCDVDNDITCDDMRTLLLHPWTKRGWGHGTTYKAKGTLRGTYPRNWGAPWSKIPGLLLGRFMTPDYPSTWHLSDPSWTDKPRYALDALARACDAQLARHNVGWLLTSLRPTDSADALAFDFGVGQDTGASVSYRTGVTTVRGLTPEARAAIAGPVPIEDRTAGIRWLFQRGNAAWERLAGPEAPPPRDHTHPPDNPRWQGTASRTHIPRSSWAAHGVFSPLMRGGCWAGASKPLPCTPCGKSPKGSVSNRTYKTAGVRLSKIGRLFCWDGIVPVEYSWTDKQRPVPPPDGGPERPRERSHNIPPPKSSGIRGPGHADAFKPGPKRSDPVLYDTSALEAHIQKTITDAMLSAKPIPYSDAGFPVLRDAYARAWQDLPDDQRAWYGEVDTAAQALVSGHATPEQTALLSDGLARAADPARIAAVFTQSTPWTMDEFEKARAAQLAHEQARETERLKSAAETQWDADVSAWGFRPEALEISPGRPVREFRVNPADVSIWIDGVQVSGPVLDPRYYHPAQPVKLVSSAPARPEYRPDDPLCFSDGPRVRDFPPRAFAAICQALRDRDPAITQAIRGVPGSMMRDPFLSAAEWALCARIHSGEQGIPGREIGNLPTRLIRLGLAERPADMGGFPMWVFTAPMAKILDAWVQPAQTLEPRG